MRSNWNGWHEHDANGWHEHDDDDVHVRGGKVSEQFS